MITQAQRHVCNRSLADLFGPEAHVRLADIAIASGASFMETGHSEFTLERTATHTSLTARMKGDEHHQSRPIWEQVQTNLNQA